MCVYMNTYSKQVQNNFLRILYIVSKYMKMVLLSEILLLDIR